MKININKCKQKNKKCHYATIPSFQLINDTKGHHFVKRVWISEYWEYRPEHFMTKLLWKLDQNPHKRQSGGRVGKVSASQSTGCGFEPYIGSWTWFSHMTPVLVVSRKDLRVIYTSCRNLFCSWAKTSTFNKLSMDTPCNEISCLLPLQKSQK